MRKEVIAKEVLKIAKELMAARVTISVDFSQEKRVFEKFKNEHPWLKCTFDGSGNTDVFWKISNGKESKIIGFDYFEKTDRYYTVFELEGKQYNSLQEALDNLNFNEKLDKDFYEGLSYKQQCEVCKYLLQSDGEKFVKGILDFSKNPEQDLKECVIQPIQDDAQWFIKVCNITDKTCQQAVYDIAEGKDIKKNAQKLFDKYNEYGYKINNTPLIYTDDYDNDNWTTWLNYNFNDYKPNGRYFDNFVNGLVYNNAPFNHLTDKQKRDIIDIINKTK